MQPTESQTVETLNKENRPIRGSGCCTAIEHRPHDLADVGSIPDSSGLIC